MLQISLKNKLLKFNIPYHIVFKNKNIYEQKMFFHSIPTHRSIYFYKKGIENISVKVRFHMDAMSLPIWSSFKLKIKIITNLPQAIDNFTPQ